MSGGSASFTLDDPRINASEAPYTYLLPTQERLAAVLPGDLVKLVFRPTVAGTKWDAERMWVQVESVSNSGFAGFLDNEPDDIPGLHAGQPVTCERWRVIDIMFAPEREASAPRDTRREYWERCLVDQAVLDSDLQVGYVYRVEPELSKPDDRYPDSGWRIRGDMRDATDEELETREFAYVALGAVLNRDDTWLHLIDEPVGSAFDRDFVANTYVLSED
jgi:uncharacterized protein YegJ (DUF2314 family)